MINMTTNYSLFKKHERNRDLEDPNLKKIKNSIKARNLLHLRPILIDKDYRVIDGQHRLKIAEELQIPIYYLIQVDCQPEDIILLNANQKNWTIKDYFTYFLNDNLEEYVKLNEYLTKNKLDLHLALAILKQNDGDSYTNFRKGRYIFPTNTFQLNQRYIYLKNVQEYLYKKMITDKKFLYHSKFVKAFLTFINYDTVDTNIFLKKIELRVDWFRYCSRCMDYIEIFKNIYNYKNAHPCNKFD